MTLTIDSVVENAGLLERDELIDRKPYMIDEYENESLISEIPLKKFQLIMEFFENAGFYGYYRVSHKNNLGDYTTKVRQVNSQTPPEIPGIIFYDSSTYPNSDYNNWKNYPNLYINEGQLILEIPSFLEMTQTYEENYFNSLVKKLQKELDDQ